MKFSENWLRSWVNPPVDTEELARQLTRAGLEVESTESVAGDLGGVVVGEVVSAAAHPNADRLTLCEVSAGGEERFSVVCGAPNARVGLRSAFAPVGTKLPGGNRIRRSKIRGVTSEGMLCSARELGLGDEHEGVLDLGVSAPVGAALGDFLELDDTAIEINLTPNRGECLGIAGIAREVGAINQCPVMIPDVTAAKSTIKDRFPIALEAPGDCPRYVGRMIRGIEPRAQTPVWMRERLRRCGLRSISPVVDVTNYVMLELGQPMHAFDLARLEGGVRVRKARPGETLVLLDERKVEIDPSTLVIADEHRAVALAGIMGGLDSAVSAETRDIFLESAFFTPASVIGQARLYGLRTDASHRFERGVDPELQRRAAERATTLLVEIVGGEPGPVVDEVSAVNMPRRAPIRLRSERIERLIGVRFEAAVVVELLERLGMLVEPGPGGTNWQVTPPSYRFDLTMEADLIEELARLVGYDAVPSVGLPGLGARPEVPEAAVSAVGRRRALVARGYQEAVTYSFVDPGLQGLLDPEATPIPLANPISSEMAVMRTNLWPGLVQALVYNVNRQRERVRLFETGLVFHRVDPATGRGPHPVDGFSQVAGLSQVKCIAGLATGPVSPMQWGEAGRPVDFFDVKSDLESVLGLTRRAESFAFVAAAHPALHPGQTASIEAGGRRVGLIGALHPEVAQKLKLQSVTYVFQLVEELIAGGRVPAFAPVSRYPLVRRDIAMIVDDSTSAAALRDCVGQASPDVLKNLELFDVYRGESIDRGKKSVALGLTFQAPSRTLGDDEIDGHVRGIVDALERAFGAVLRG